MTVYIRILSVASAALLGSAIQTQAPAWSPDGSKAQREGHRVSSKVAMCIHGNARTFAEADVLDSLKMLTSKLRQRADVDIFAHLTLSGAAPKGQKGRDFPAVSIERSEAERALATVNSTAFSLEDSSETVTVDNIDEYAHNAKECFSAGWWKEPEHLARSLNQLLHMKQCIQQVRESEAHQKVTYDSFILARPDLIYKEQCKFEGQFDFEGVANGTHIYRVRDWFMVIPRRLVDKLFAATPLTCSPGERCCGRIGNSEDMFEHLIGIHSYPSGPASWCDLSTESFKELGMYLYEKCISIKRPATLDRLQPYRRSPCYGNDFIKGKADAILRKR